MHFKSVIAALLAFLTLALLAGAQQQQQGVSGPPGKLPSSDIQDYHDSNAHGPSTDISSTDGNQVTNGDGTWYYNYNLRLYQSDLKFMLVKPMLSWDGKNFVPNGNYKLTFMDHEANPTGSRFVHPIH